MVAHSYFEIQAFACTDLGLVRSGNEDSLFVANLTDETGLADSGILRFSSGPKGSLFAVADGMGGAAAGEMASRLCLETLYAEVLGMIRSTRGLNSDFLDQILIEAVGTANRRVFELGRSHEEYAGMGTTLTAGLEHQGNLVIGQIGDSRAYLIRERGIRQLTRDQSLVSRLVSDGELTEEEARHHPDRNVLLQALGVRDSVELVLRSLAVHPEDILLLCSDGLHSQMSGDEMCQIVTGTGNTRDACLELVDLANRRGGPDNITAILVQFLPGGRRF